MLSIVHTPFIVRIFIDLLKDMTIAGSGDGNILVYDNDNGKCLYGFGAMT